MLHDALHKTKAEDEYQCQSFDICSACCSNLVVSISDGWLKRDHVGHKVYNLASFLLAS